MKAPKKWLQIVRNLLSITIPAALILPMTAHGQSGGLMYVPERFGVVDITPNNMSSEAEENSQPTLAVGTGTNFNDFVVHYFLPQSDLVNDIFTSVNGGTVWQLAGGFRMGD